MGSCAMSHARSGSTGTTAHIRRAATAARRFVILAALTALAGCAAIKTMNDAIDPLAPPLGDPSRPVMVQGQGAIACSYEFRMPSEGFQMGGLITGMRLEPVGDSTKKISLWAGSRDVPVHYAKQLPHEANVTAPRMYIYSLPPGIYRIKEMTIGADYRNTRDFNVSNSPEVTVVAGQLGYVGNFYIQYMTRFTSKGDLVLRSASLSGPNNRFERDIQELKSVDKRLDNVIIVNTLAH